MEASASTPKHRGKRLPDGRNDYSQYDQDLLRAKNAGLRVKFSMAANTDRTDHDGGIIGVVCKVSSDAVQIEVDDVKPWLNKSMIVMAEVL